MLASFPFDLSFCISSVLSLVIHRGVPPSRQTLGCHTNFSCILVSCKFFSQNSWTPYGPGTFQFGIFFDIFLSLSCEICTRARLLVYFLISLNYVGSLLCSTSWTQISVQMFFFLVCEVLQHIFPLYFHLFDYEIDSNYFKKSCFVEIDSPFAGIC